MLTVNFVFRQNINEICTKGRILCNFLCKMSVSNLNVSRQILGLLSQLSSSEAEHGKEGKEKGRLNLYQDNISSSHLA